MFFVVRWRPSCTTPQSYHAPVTSRLLFLPSERTAAFTWELRMQVCIRPRSLWSYRSCSFCCISGPVFHYRLNGFFHSQRKTLSPNHIKIQPGVLSVTLVANKPAVILRSCSGLCQRINWSCSGRGFSRAWRHCPDWSLTPGSQFRAVPSWGPICCGTEGSCWRCWENTSRSERRTHYSSASV